MSKNEKDKVISNFASIFIEEVIPRFLKSKYVYSLYTITTGYQADISCKLKESLKTVIHLKVTCDELEEAINKKCTR